MDKRSKDLMSYSRKLDKDTQPCPVCGTKIGNVSGTKNAIWTNSGFKDACCN